MVSVKIKFKPSTVEGKEGSLYYQLIQGRSIRQIFTDYHLFASEWNSYEERVVISGGRSTYLRSLAEQVGWDKERLRGIIRNFWDDGRSFSVDDVVTAFKERSTAVSLFGFMTSTINNLRDLGKERTAETYQASLNRFMRFRDGADLPVDGLNRTILMRYEGYLKEQGLALNTVSFYMRILRAVYNRAVDAGLAEPRNPFRHVYTGVEKTKKRAIPVKTIKRLRLMNLAEEPAAELSRDMFLFSFFTRGMSFVDMAYLRKTDLRNGHLTYRRRKTDQQLTMKWEPCMEKIVEKYAVEDSEYMLPFIKTRENSRRQYQNGLHFVNYHLHNLAQRLKLDCPLTMYVARHSWASAAKAKNIPISVISQALGHESESTTQIYLAALETSVVDRANRKIIGLI